MSNRIDYLDSEIEVPEGAYTNVEGETPELNEENFMKLCRKVTEIQLKREDRFIELEGSIKSLEDRLHQVENKLDETDRIVDDFSKIREDVRETAKVVSLMRVEASELQHLEQNP